MDWEKGLEHEPPEGVDLILFDHSGYGPWIGRFNATKRAFIVAQPAETEWLGENASWCVIELPKVI